LEHEGDIFEENPLRLVAAQSNESEEFVDDSGLIPVDAIGLPGLAEILAREAGCNEVHPRQRADLTDIPFETHLGKMRGEDVASSFVDLAQ
jgi:hypothetical protein